jgi:hypothetical protein
MPAKKVAASSTHAEIMQLSGAVRSVRLFSSFALLFQAARVFRASLCAFLGAIVAAKIVATAAGTGALAEKKGQSGGQIACIRCAAISDSGSAQPACKRSGVLRAIAVIGAAGFPSRRARSGTGQVETQGARTGRGLLPPRSASRAPCRSRQHAARVSRTSVCTPSRCAPSRAAGAAPPVLQASNPFEGTARGCGAGVAVLTAHTLDNSQV